jgi:hypothetical protein
MDGWPLVALVYATQGLAGDLVGRALGGARPARLERLAQALLLGPAAIALQMMLLSLLSIPFSLPVVLGPWWLAAAVVWRRSRRAAGPMAAVAPTAPSRASARPTAVLVSLVLLLFAVLVWIGLRTPVFDSDPLNNFAFPARLFETHRSLAGDVIADLRAVGHLEYPPLVALNEALVFMAAGPERLRAVMPFFALPWLALQLLVLSAACRRLRWELAVPLSLLALLVPEAFALGTVGLADLRLAATVLLLATTGAALLRQPGGPQAARFAAAAIACALTKIEGLSLAVAAAIVFVPALTVRRRLSLRAGAAAELATLAAAALWPLYLAAHGATIGSLDPGAVRASSSGLLERFGQAARGFFAFALSSPVASRFYGPLWQLAVLAAIVGLARRAARRETCALLVALAAHVGLYCLLLAQASQPVEWTLQAAGLRLLTHTIAWPLLLLVAALAV